MRSDLLSLDRTEAAVLQAALELLEKLAAQRGYPLSREVARLKGDVATFVGRAARHVDATTRPVSGEMPHDSDELIDTEAASVMSGLTVGAVRKRCRTGRWSGVARRIRGHWWVPMNVVAQEVA